MIVLVPKSRPEEKLRVVAYRNLVRNVYHPRQTGTERTEGTEGTAATEGTKGMKGTEWSWSLLFTNW